MSRYAEIFRYGVQFVVNVVVATLLSAGVAFAQDVDPFAANNGLYPSAGEWSDPFRLNTSDFVVLKCGV